MSEQARIETAIDTTIDNCEVLRARLAKYEDADGKQITTIAEQAREIERLQLTCNDLDDQNERIYAELAAMKAKHNVDFVRRARTVAANIEAHESELDRYAVSLEYMDVLRAQVEVLEAWKAEELAVMNPLMDYASSVCTGPLGCSITEWLVEDHKAQAREIERLKEGRDSLILVRDDYKSQVNEYRELWAKAAIKANPSVVVGMLLDTLELWLADYEAVASNPDFEPFPHVADLEAKTRDALAEVARLNSSPVSAGEVVAYWSDFSMVSVRFGDRVRTYVESCAPSHSEQVREGWQLVPVEPIDAMLEAGDKYIGTPATYKAMLSACPSPAITKDFSQFLSAVMDAAGLIRHGRQSKELSEYLGMKCMEYRGAAPSAGSQEQG